MDVCPYAPKHSLKNDNFSFSFIADIKKHAQELYALINYGEMRKKLVFVNAKACMKLKELVYHGSVSIRVKGKNIRIKTPSCKALRQLNQMEGKVTSSQKTTKHEFSRIIFGIRYQNGKRK